MCKQVSNQRSFCTFYQEIHDKLSRVTGDLDRVQEKMYDFEINKKNNLIFYGIPGETRETPPVLMTKVGLKKYLDDKIQMLRS